MIELLGPEVDFFKHVFVSIEICAMTYLLHLIV